MLLDPTTAVLMLSVLISRDHTSVLVTLDILEMDVIVWVNVFQTNVVPFLCGILNTDGTIIAMAYDANSKSKSHVWHGRMRESIAEWLPGRGSENIK